VFTAKLRNQDSYSSKVQDLSNHEQELRNRSREQEDEKDRQHAPGANEQHLLLLVELPEKRCQYYHGIA